MAGIAPGNPTAFSTSLLVDAGEGREQDAVALPRNEAHRRKISRKP
jgi:hypothetical protein